MSKLIRFLAIMLGALCAGLGGWVPAAVHYVAPNGTATWAASVNEATPCSGRIAAENAVAGDIVYYRGGTYVPAADGVYEWQVMSKWDSVAWNPQHSGTADQPITFMAYPGETPTFQTYTDGPVLGSARRDYIIWDGIQITPSNSFHADIGIFYGADYCTVRNITVQGYPNCPTTDNGQILFAKDITHLTIQNCHFYGQTGPAGALNAAAIKLYNTSSTLVENCEIDNNYTGIDDKDGSTHNVYRYNYFHDQDGTSFALRTESTGPEPLDCSIYNNIFVGGTYAIALSGDRPKHNIKIYNNTIYNPSQVGIYTNKTVENLQVYNNIIYIAPRLLSYSIYSPLGSLPGLDTNNNCYYTTSPRWDYLNQQSYFSLAAWRSGSGCDAASLYTNPLLVNPGGTTVADYKLQTSSPCRSGGRIGSAMGAYVTGNEVIGVHGQDAMPKPRNLRLLDQ